MTMTTKFAIYWHYQLWNWLANNPDKYKDEWPEWNSRFINIEVPNFCFSCKVMYQRENMRIGYWFKKSHCRACLLRWPGNKELNTCEFLRTKNNIDDDNQRGLYSLWNDRENDNKASQLARAIRDLPLRDYESDDGSEVIKDGKIIIYNGVQE
jgi:hypothetical protein